MREAIASADVGDEQLREDPTVNELERRAAEILGQEDSVFVPDRDDGERDRDQGARAAWRRADRRGELAHPVGELGGPAVHAGLMTAADPGARGPLHARRDAGRPRAAATSATCRRRGSSRSRTRTTPPAGASGRSPRSRRWPRPAASSSSLSTSTARGCSTPRSRAARSRRAIAGRGPTRSRSASRRASAVRSARSSRARRSGCCLARRYKHQFGGAMRQAGIVAAACVYALDNHVERLAEDHARARRLGGGARRGRGRRRPRAGRDELRPDRRRRRSGLPPPRPLERMLGEGVRVSPTY